MTVLTDAFHHDNRLLQLNEDVYVFGSYPFAGVVVTGEGCFAVDGPMSPRNSIPWSHFIGEQGPLRYQVYCEHHADHIASACYMKPEILVASEKTAAEMCTTAEMLGALNGWARDSQLVDGSLSDFRMWRPNMTFTGRLNLTLGGKRFVIFQAPGHTTGSSVIHAVDDRVAFIADLGFTPAIQSGDPFHWLQALAVLEMLDVDWYVQGHGDPFRRAALSEWRTVLLDLLDRSRGYKGEGVGPDEIVQMGGMFAHFARPRHVGLADTPPRLKDLAATDLQREGAHQVLAAIDSHPSDLLLGAAASP